MNPLQMSYIQQLAKVAAEKKARTDPMYPLIGLGLGGAIGAAGHFWDRKKLIDRIQEEDDPDIRKYLESGLKEEEGDLMNRTLFPAALGGLAGIGAKAFAGRNKYGSCKEKEKEAALKAFQKVAKSPAWQRKSGKNSEGGLNAKGRASYNKSTGGNLKAPVTSKKPKGKAKKRKASFCARMGGMKKKNTSKATANDPDSRINKSLRKWNC